MMNNLKNRTTKRNGRYATWEGIRCQELENAIESGELVPVVRCKDCKYYKSPVREEKQALDFDKICKQIQTLNRGF